VALDAARALGVVAMVCGHTLDALLASSERTRPGVVAYWAARGLTLPLFLTVSGWAVTVAITRSGARGWAVPRARLGRVLLLLAIGYALRWPGWDLAGLWNGGMEPWAHLLAFDALHLIAVALLAASLVLALPWSAREQALLFLLLAVLSVALGLRPPAPLVPLTTDLPARGPALAFVQATGGTSPFPIFPWAAHFFAGALLGLVSRSAPRRIAASMAGVGAVLVAGTFWTGVATMPVGHPLLLTFRAGVILLLLAALSVVPAGLAARLAPLGRASLGVYAIHVPIVYGWSTLPGLAARVGPTLPVGGALAAAAAVLAASYALYRGFELARRGVAKRLAPALVLLLGPPALAQAAPAAVPGPPRGAPLVVAIVVDQLPAWAAQERWPLLPEGGGFARLRREGTWVKELRYLHALTETAPGHAALFTGRTPRENGIVANVVVRDDLPGRPATSILEDPRTRLAGTAAIRPGASLARLEGDTVADALRARDPEAVIVAVSLKDRGALLGGGRRPTWAAWFDGDGRGGAALVTSSALPAVPGWATRLTPDLSPGSPLRWSLLDPAFVASHAATGDDQEGEGVESGGRTFPHAIATAPDRLRAFRASPMADEALVDLALEAVRRQRRPDHPMLLVLSLSANDYVGHTFGPDSWEAWDELLRLDGTLARLLTGLDQQVGPGGHAEVLSADHGMAPLPEVVAARTPAWCAPGAPDPHERPCAPGLRLDDEEVRAALEVAVAKALGEPARAARPARWVEAFADPLVYLSAEARAAPPARRAVIDGAVSAAAARLPGIAGSFALSGLPGTCPPAADESLPALVCRASRPEVGDVYLVPTPGSFFWSGRTGSSHGSPYLYDRAVPLLARLPGGAQGEVVARGLFGSYRATLWYALTGEDVAGPYGGVVGRRVIGGRPRPGRRPRAARPSRRVRRASPPRSPRDPRRGSPPA
jgi:predicted AlkP superfamily pyrophosphatase or phosphodiesterase/peptidoglycan/LPS O-acetylase OafA/YrhL